MKNKLIHHYYDLRHASRNCPETIEAMKRSVATRMKRIEDLLWERYQYDIALNRRTI